MLSTSKGCHRRRGRRDARRPCLHRRGVLVEQVDRRLAAPCANGQAVAGWASSCARLVDSVRWAFACSWLAIVMRAALVRQHRSFGITGSRRSDPCRGVPVGLALALHPSAEVAHPGEPSSRRVAGVALADLDQPAAGRRAPLCSYAAMPKIGKALHIPSRTDGEVPAFRSAQAHSPGRDPRQETWSSRRHGSGQRFWAGSDFSDGRRRRCQQPGECGLGRRRNQ